MIEIGELFPTDIEKVNHLIKTVDDMHICYGGPGVSSFTNVSPMCAYTKIYQINGSISYVHLKLIKDQFVNFVQSWTKL